MSKKETEVETKERVNEPVQALSLRDIIFQAKDLPTKKVMVPEWTPEPLYARSMTGVERDAFELGLTIGEGEDVKMDRANFRAKLVVQTLCSDPEGKNRVFQDGDAVALGQKSSAAIDKCFAVSSKLAGMDKKTEEAMLKNSEATQD